MKVNRPKSTSEGLGRRAVLGGIGVIAGTAACVGQQVSAEELRNIEPGDERHLAYRETDHIRWFYRRARM